MSTNTRVIWTNPLDPAVAAQLTAKGDETMNLQTQAPTINIDPETNNIVAVRYWIDLPSANDWITYVNQFNPISATIDA